MNRKHLVLAGAGAVVAALLIWLLAFRGGDDGKQEQAGDAPDRDRAGQRGTAGASGGGPSDPQAPARDLTSIDPPDPDGTLVLEGQVLGDDDQPVGGAIVWLDSNPARSATTEDDGSFAFDKLLPRVYALTARAGDASGGPAVVRLGKDTGPVVLRLREGAILEVLVTAAADGAPIVNAKVELREAGAPSSATAADGLATFKGLAAGWSMVVVSADGYGRGTALATIGAAGSTQRVAIALRKGARLAGKVTDEAGNPIAGAQVVLRDAGSMIPDDEITLSAADGSFAYGAVGAGSYRLIARDRTHAPGVSEIISVDGTSAREGVVVVLRAGGAVRGRVVTAKKLPAAFAQVKVAIEDGGDRQVTADDQGRFEIAGLPRAKVRMRAEDDQAASAIVDVDLEAHDLVSDLELVLDVAGTIAGVVVDKQGEPIPEAQVSAMPDFLASGGRGLEDLELAGFSSAVTDGGGAFVLRGLPDGAYQLWASRTASTQMMFTREGTKARTGDAAVRIVLPEPGGLTGTIRFADGTTPPVASVQVGFVPSTAAVKGEFTVRDLPPGKHDLHVRGPDFAELVMRGVTVEEGAINDLGTLTVKRGRRVAGRVVDHAGAPVAGARVLVGQILFSEGTTSTGNPALEEQLGQRSAVTAADGTFAIQGAPEKASSIIAEHADRGRSDAMPVAAGAHDLLELVLTLRGYGSITGKVTMDGRPAGEVQVTANARASTGHVVVVATAPDGTFVIDKIPEGTHRVTASKMDNMQMRTGAADATVVVGKRTEVELDIPVGSITFIVQIKGKGGATIDAAQVFLFRGTVVAENAKQVVDRMLAGEHAGFDTWLGGPDGLRFEKMVPGDYSVCTLPINGNLADPAFGQRLQEHLEDLKVHCTPRAIEASPAEQTYVAVVPPMEPLPAE